MIESEDQYPSENQAAVGPHLLHALFLIIASFVVYPLGYTLYLSLCEYNFAFDAAPVFQGFANYVNMFKDSKFITATLNTFQFAAVDFVLLMVVPLILALMLFFKGRHTWLFRTAIFDLHADRRAGFPRVHRVHLAVVVGL